MKIVIADCSLAELGWELMSWQGFVRRKADDFDRVIICTTAGREALYSDFADEFIVHSVPLLRDCFEQREIYDKPAWAEYRARVDKRVKELEAEGHDVTILTAKKYIPVEKQTFVQYGNAELALQRGDMFDIVIHARNKESNNPYYRVYNWPIEKWDRVVAVLRKRGLSVAAIGTRDGAFLPVGAIDMRDTDMTRLMDMMAACRLVIGPSSGPMHLAALCKAPHFVWTGKQWSSTIKAYNSERYTWKWNPFRTFCEVIDDDPDLAPDAVINGVIRTLTELAGDDAPDEVPGTAIARKMIKYWRKRVAREGRDYVSRCRRNTEAQTEIVSERLTTLLGGGRFQHGLDFGSGWGRFTGVLAEHCNKVTAVDLVDNFRKDLPDHVSFQHIGFPTKIGLPDTSVDLLIAVLVFQHIMDDNWLAEASAEIRRVLAESAMVIIIDDNGKPAGHVRQRAADEFRRVLNLGWHEDKLFDLDSSGSHHIIVGSHMGAPR